jgi:hypothetical protein
MAKWWCNNTKQGTNQGTKCTQHQITVSNVHVFIPWPSKGYLSWMEALPHVWDSQRWLTDTGVCLLFICYLCRISGCCYSFIYIQDSIVKWRYSIQYFSPIYVEQGSKTVIFTVTLLWCESFLEDAGAVAKIC